MNSRSLLTVAIFGLLLNFAVAEDEEGGAASSGKNEARLLVGKHVRENRYYLLQFYSSFTIQEDYTQSNKLNYTHKNKIIIIKY